MIIDDRGVMLCPTCGGQHSHLSDIERYKGENPAGSDCVTLNFEGECGHKWGVEFEQHKGETYVDEADNTYLRYEI